MRRGCDRHLPCLNQVKNWVAWFLSPVKLLKVVESHQRKDYCESSLIVLYDERT